MKTIIQSVIAIASVCLLAGCETTGISPRESAGVGYPNYILSLQASGTNAPEKISAPIRLAVVQVGEDGPPQAMLDKLAAQKNLVSSVDGLPLPGDAANLMFVPRTGMQVPNYDDRVKKVCDIARATGADFVFLFGGSMDSWQENNFSSVFDITIIGGTLFPGTKIHVEGKGAGALISTTTRQPILFVNSEARETAFSPDFFVDGKTMGLRAEVRDQLAAKLTEQLTDKLPEIIAH